MNKTSKIRINYAIGIGFMLLLSVVLYKQVRVQMDKLEGQPIDWNGPVCWLVAAVALGLLNLALEVWKWHYLVTRSDELSWARATRSFLTGIALSFITPNRVGEYPGRLIALEKKNTVRLLSLSVLGAFAQMYITILLGNAGLLFALSLPKVEPWLPWVIMGNVGFTLALTLFFFRFEFFAVRLEHLRWLRKYFTYRRLVRRIQASDQWVILGISLLRYAAFALELMALLYFFNVHISPATLVFLCNLFFWIMTVVPSIALAELGVRGQTGVLLFGMFSDNTLGILLATFCLWFINLLLPALAGSVIVLRKKWIA